MAKKLTKEKGEDLVPPELTWEDKIIEDNFERWKKKRGLDGPPEEQQPVKEAPVVPEEPPQQTSFEATAQDLIGHTQRYHNKINHIFMDF